MLKVPKLSGNFVCGPCNDGSARYIVEERRISYLLPRKENTVTINGLFAHCEKCGKYARIADIEEYNAALAAEAYENPALNLSIEAEAEQNDDVAVAEAVNAPEADIEIGDISLTTTSDTFVEDADGQLELSSFII